MGDGLVLEQGTHNELLSHTDGPYSRLVTAQKLRDKREVDIDDSGSNANGIDKAEDIETEVREVAPLERKNTTTRSLASKIIEEKRNHAGEKKNYNLLYLFMRMGQLNRAGWVNYAFGTLAAIGGCLPVCVTVIFSD